MEQNFVCLNCKNNTKNSICKKCGQLNFQQNNKNIFDFIITKNDSQKNQKILELNKRIDESGYDKGLSNFLEEHPSIKNKFNDEEVFQRADGIFHCYHENMQNCLEIGSKLGNVTEVLSHNFGNVFSLDPNKENLEFQHRKFQHNKRNNIVLIRSEYHKLPFPDNYFDFIVCNELSEKIMSKKNNSRPYLSVWFEEIRRVLKNNGYFYFTIHNKNGFDFLNRGKIKLNIKKKNNSEFLSYDECSKILKTFGFNFKIYWSLPSLKSPLYSGTLNNKNAIKWFFKNLDKFLPKTKLISKKKRMFYTFLKYCNGELLKYFISKYSPSYHFCSTQNGEFKNTIEEEILEKTNASEFLTLSRRLKVIYLIFDHKGKPTKVAIVRKFSFNSIDDISYYKIKKYKGIFSDDERIIYEDWKKGRMLDPTKEKEVFAALKWIYDFQNKTKNEKLTENDINSEIIEIEKELVNYYPNSFFYKEWLKKYEKYLKNNTIFKTSLHGDLSFRNFLIDVSNDKINAIDWDSFEEKGNPINDFVNFTFRTIIFKKDDSLEIFKEKIKGENHKFNESLKKVQKGFLDHFGFELNLLILIRFHLLRKIVIKGKKGLNIEKDLKMIELLKNISNSQEQGTSQD